MRRRRLMRPAMILALFVAQSASGANDDRSPIGQRVANLEFKDTRFLTRSLDDFAAKKAFVIVATNTTCPLVQHYLPVLAQLEKQYRDRGVQFLALNVGPDDTIVAMATQAVETNTEFPFVKDIDSICAKSLGLQRTPETVVLDSDYRIRYRGRIDDQFRLTGERPRADRHDLRDALDDLLAGRAVAREATTVDGCLITAAVPLGQGLVPTYSRAIAPLVQRHCQDCHHPGTEAPFPLISYRDVVSQSAMIAEVVADRRMPPWFASDKHGTFANRRGLSERERETFLRWIQGGMPRGDTAQEPKPRKFPTGRWRIGEPDLTTTMLLAHELPASGSVDYRYAILPYLFTHDTWVQSVEIISDNSRVVHHANLAYNKVGERARQENFITGRVPGGDPMVLDDGTAYLIPKGSVLGLQIHYTTTGKPERARLSVGLKFPRVEVRNQLRHQQVSATRFQIPPQAPAHPVSARRGLEFDATGVGLFAHMHARGKDMTFLARHPNGLTDTLLLIPNYNFDWQQSYRWAPGTKTFPKGTRFEVLAHFDNSAFNPYNPDSSQTVGNGDQTFNEMMYGFYFYTRNDEDLHLSIDPKTGAVLPHDPVETPRP
ncbi:Thiol-disulfide isomerase or thioredoxin [Singulisphaera sp. GP187]|uniref:redoxin family protein n=1 Tax=Singulisphaera sp. GP187 TaxID=1882752 RepID=UPI0009262E8E|nr:redoxin family protein [Singulisphaera sp. GP187]SIO60471.1 Thiol-disulfide isomerase or thioredoxin [Singulisphaera sp. GP187]